jgi:nucleoporin NUP82
LGVFPIETPPVQVNVLPRFVLDPLYSDTFYVQHATGTHAVGFGRWSKDILVAMALSEDERATAMERVLHAATPSDVIRVVDSTGSAPENALNEVTGLCIIIDIYLTYSFLALMQSGALVAMELGLRVEESEEEGILSLQAAPLSDLQAGPAPYTSLLGDGPSFVPPEPFKTVNGLPYHPRSAIKGRHSSQEVTVSTETLRVLATVVSTLRGEMRKIVQGGNVVQSRLELQIKELNRQLSKLSETRNRLDQGRVRQETLDKRIKGVMEKQSSLVKKSDWLLQKLVENHSPEVSIYESRWFKELERLEEDVGSKTEDTKEAHGLHARVMKLQYQLELLRPDLINMKHKSAKDTSELMGAKQLQSVESLLAKESQLLATNRDKISHLQSRIQRQIMYY